MITQPDTLAYYKVDCWTRIIADASPFGLGAVLAQYQANLWRVIAYASRSLSDAERRYTQTEREALVLVWACKWFDFYVCGQLLELETDHKPLERIYSGTSKPCARIEREAVRLQSYNFKVVHRPGKANIADTLSKLIFFDKCLDAGEEFGYVRVTVENCVMGSCTFSERDRASLF